MWGASGYTALYKHSALQGPGKAPLPSPRWEWHCKPTGIHGVQWAGLHAPPAPTVLPGDRSVSLQPEPDRPAWRCTTTCVRVCLMIYYTCCSGIITLCVPLTAVLPVAGAMCGCRAGTPCISFWPWGGLNTPDSPLIYAPDCDANIAEH